MKIEWYGISQQAKTPEHCHDHLGLTNFHRLKFRTTRDCLVSKGDSKSLPVLLVFVSTERSRGMATELTKRIVSDTINDFRYAGRASILEKEDVEKWLKYKIEDLLGSGGTLVREGFHSDLQHLSLTLAVFSERRVLLAQTHEHCLYLIRKGHCSDWISEGTRFNEDLMAPFQAGSIDLHRGDLLCFATPAVRELFTPEKAIEAVDKARSPEAMEAAVSRMVTRTTELRPGRPVGATLVRIR
jgi:hypothetical protein